MALPRQFRRLRVALVGVGDVAKRTLTQQLGRNLGSHGPRLILASRAGWDTIPDSLKPTLIHNRHAVLRTDVDRRSDTERLIQISQAAIVYVPTADASARNHAKDSRMRLMARCIRKSGRRLPLVYLSTTGVYGNHQGAVVTEVSNCRPSQARSQRRLDAERILRPLGAHILRAPGIYAEDRLPTARLAARHPALRAEDDVFTNHIHADDLGYMAWIAVFRGRPARVTNAVDKTDLKMADYFDAVADTLGQPRPPRVSREEMRALGKTGVINPMMMSFLSESRRVRTTRLDTELRLKLRYPTVLHTLEKLRAQLGAR